MLGRLRAKAVGFTMLCIGPAIASVGAAMFFFTRTGPQSTLVTLIVATGLLIALASVALGRDADGRSSCLGAAARISARQRGRARA